MQAYCLCKGISHQTMEPVPPFSDTVPAMGPLQLEGRDTGARVHPG